MTTAVCPGSFDPITNGHLDIVRRASHSFDEVIVLVTGNPSKKSGLFSVDERMALISEVTADIPGVRVDSWGGLLVDYTNEHRVTALVKGLRSSLDDTYFLMTDEKYGYVSSSLCKEVAKYGGDVTGLVPHTVREAMREKFQ